MTAQSNCKAWESKHREDVTRVWNRIFGENDAILGGDLSGVVAQIAADAVELGRLINEPSLESSDGSLSHNVESIEFLLERISTYSDRLRERSVPSEDLALIHEEGRLFSFVTDSESGYIEAATFAAACEALRERLPDAAVDDGAWGWVRDEDGQLFEINC